MEQLALQSEGARAKDLTGEMTGSEETSTPSGGAGGNGDTKFTNDNEPPKSKIWFNDNMIWKSSDVQKVWAPNEGLRKVHFRKGTNRVLYRYENGHNAGCFSLFICLKSSANAPIDVNVPKGP